VFFPTIVFENQTSSNGLINFFGVRSIRCCLSFSNQIGLCFTSSL
jgi:hypothetical protein